MRPIIPSEHQLHTFLHVLNRLQRLEHLARAAKSGCLSAGELRAVHWNLRCLRKLASPSVMDCYVTLKRKEPALADRPELFSLAVALAHFGRRRGPNWRGRA